jgi:hypothetical protein
MEKLRYIHRNPAKRGLAAPEDWRWSSYRFYLLDEPWLVRVNEGWGKISFRARADLATSEAVHILYPPAQHGNYERVVGYYIPTAKNMMVKNFFQQFGFLPVDTSNGVGTEWSLRVDQYVQRKVFIHELSTYTITTQ